MITYNHEKYIAQSLDSVLMQKTDFEYELVIGEDASTDHTRDIIVECQNRYPEIIRLLPPAANMGVLRNMARTLKACRGQYVAVLEGDDYWTSPHKLQAQVNFLDSHPDYAICFHNSEVVYEAGYPGPRYWPGYWTENPKETSTIEDLLMNNFIPHSAVMFRNGLFGELPEWFYGLEAGDWAWNVLNAQHGKIGCLKEVMAVYRVHGESVWSSRGMELMIPPIIRALDCFNLHLGYRYRRVIAKSKQKNYRVLEIASEELGDLRGARTALHEVFAQNLILRSLPSPWDLKTLCRLYLRRPYFLLKSLKQALRSTKR